MSQPRPLFAPAHEHAVKGFAPVVSQQVEGYFDVARNADYGRWRRLA